MTEETSPAQWLFTVPYMVFMSNLDLYDMEVLEKIGYVTSGDARIDRGRMLERRPAYKTIMQLVKHHEEGHYIRFERTEDIIEIYAKINEHIQEWERVVTTLLHYPEPPVDDLRALSIFADGIYEKAYVHDKNASRRSEFEKRYFGEPATQHGLQRYRVFGRGGVQPAQPTNVTPIAPHDGLVDRIINNISF